MTTPKPSRAIVAIVAMLRVATGHVLGCSSTSSTGTPDAATVTSTDTAPEAPVDRTCDLEAGTDDSLMFDSIIQTANLPCTPVSDSLIALYSCPTGTTFPTLPTTCYGQTPLAVAFYTSTTYTDDCIGAPPDGQVYTEIVATEVPGPCPNGNGGGCAGTCGSLASPTGGFRAVK